MRNFVVTIDGKSYSVGVEEVGESAGSYSIAPQTVQTSAPAPKATVNAKGEKVLSPFPGLIKNTRCRRFGGKEGPAYNGA